MKIGRNQFLFCVLLLCTDLSYSAELPREISAETLLDTLVHTQIVIVDVRLASEKPAMPGLPNTAVVRISWPSETYNASGNDSFVHFYRALKELQRRGIPIVLVCGIGERSRKALNRSREFGIRSGLSHLEGGLHGNVSDPGLLLALELQ